MTMTPVPAMMQKDDAGGREMRHRYARVGKPLNM
jgi:hypothetical protein